MERRTGVNVTGGLGVSTQNLKSGSNIAWRHSSYLLRRQRVAASPVNIKIAEEGLPSVAFTCLLIHIVSFRGE